MSIHGMGRFTGFLGDNWIVNDSLERKQRHFFSKEENKKQLHKANDIKSVFHVAAFMFEPERRRRPAHDGTQPERLRFLMIHMKDSHETKPSKLTVMCPGGVCENHTAPIKIWRPTP